MKVDILISGSLALVARLRLPLDHLVSSTYSLPFYLVAPPEKKQTVESAARNMNKIKRCQRSCTAKGTFIQ